MNEMAKMKSAVFGTVLQEYYIHVYAVPHVYVEFSACWIVFASTALLADYHLILCPQRTMYVAS